MHRKFILSLLPLSVMASCTSLNTKNFQDVQHIVFDPDAGTEYFLPSEFELEHNVILPNAIINSEQPQTSENPNIFYYNQGANGYSIILPIHTMDGMINILFVAGENKDPGTPNYYEIEAAYVLEDNLQCTFESAQGQLSGDFHVLGRLLRQADTQELLAFTQYASGYSLDGLEQASSLFAPRLTNIANREAFISSPESSYKKAKPDEKKTSPFRLALRHRTTVPIMYNDREDCFVLEGLPSEGDYSGEFNKIIFDGLRPLLLSGIEVGHDQYGEPLFFTANAHRTTESPQATLFGYLQAAFAGTEVLKNSTKEGDDYTHVNLQTLHFYDDINAEGIHVFSSVTMLEYIVAPDTPNEP
jgi:hypothetical protein